MENAQFDLTPDVRLHSWSNRILILAIAGILFLTLYPFRFNFHGAAARGITNPFLLGKGLKSVESLDDFLNVLLFVPFGFGLTEKLRERGKSRGFAIAIALIAGALFSYGIEFLQIYIPERDSGWEDVFTNATGSVVGCVMFQLFGGMVLRILAACERALTAFLTRWRLVLVLVIYFALWFAVSILLQRETRLANWNPDTFLVLGNDATGRNAWSGTIRLVQIWDRAVPSEIASGLFTNPSGLNGPGLLAFYDFLSSPPYSDRLEFMPELSWTPRNPERAETNRVVLDGSSWLSSKVPVQNLVQNLQKSNRFSIRVVCTPTKGIGADGRIVSISEPSGVANLTLRQEDANLVFWFRNSLSVKKSLLAWYLPNIFRADETRDILYSYDGSNLVLYIDGKRQPIHYRLGPATALAKFFVRAKLSELSGYEYIYYALVFFPAGAIFGIAARQVQARKPESYFPCVVMILAPLVLEALLSWVGGHSFYSSQLELSFGFLMAGILWINADRKR